MPRIRRELQELAKNMAQTKTVLKKRPHFAFIAVYVSDTVLRSRKRTLSDLLTEESGKR